MASPDKQTIGRINFGPSRDLEAAAIEAGIEKIEELRREVAHWKQRCADLEAALKVAQAAEEN